MTATVKLTKPITAIDQTFAELTFREPTGRDIVAAGHPFLTIKGAGKLDAEAISAMIGRLAGIPRRSVDDLPVADWNACSEVVLGFFGDTAPTNASSIDTSSAADGGAT